MDESTATSTAFTKPGCVAMAVKILGDKWTPLIIRALAEHGQRFCRLQQDVGGVNPRTLSARLARLEAVGVVKKMVLSEIPPHTEYSLTEKGQDLIPILECMAEWGEKHAPLADVA